MFSIVLQYEIDCILSYTVQCHSTCVHCPMLMYVVLSPVGEGREGGGEGEERGGEGGVEREGELSRCARHIGTSCTVWPLQCQRPAQFSNVSDA